MDAPATHVEYMNRSTLFEKKILIATFYRIYTKINIRYKGIIAGQETVF